MESLSRLRLQLTSWYVVTFGVIIVLLGGGLFIAIRHQISEQLDRSLRAATAELARAAHIREMEAKSAQGTVVDAVDELNIPDRKLYLLTIDGRPVRPEAADDWIRAAARQAGSTGSADVERAGAESTLRLHAERFMLTSGEPLVAVAIADQVELEDRYASLIAAFGGAAIFALVLVAGGGWLLVRKSTEPVERTVEYMRRFMADAAHELRTPITVLRSRADIVLQKPRDSETYVAAIQDIASESQRLGRLVGDLLTLARADTGERPIRRERVYLDDLALDAAGAARALAQARGVRLEVDEYEEASLDGDPELVRQLVMILLDNAIKFTPPGGRVRLSVKAPGGRPTVTVEDTGIGIGAEQLPHIFERFYRADPARGRTHGSDGSNGAGTEGAGLGLAIARWIAQEHGAEITVTSDLGQGTRVVVRFPLAADQAVTTDSSA